MKGILTDKKIVADDTYQFTFKLPENTITFQPGQYAVLELLNPEFKDDRPNKRVFSIVNSPDKNNILVFTTRISQSAFKKSLNNLAIGTEVSINNIGGKFNIPDEGKIAFIAGGIGITPFMSILDNLKNNKLSRDIVMLYSNKSCSGCAYQKELELFGEQLPGFKLLLTMSNDPNWNGENRRIDATLIKDVIPDYTVRTFMIVGPPIMVNSIEKILRDELLIPNNQIIIEKLAGY